MSNLTNFGQQYLLERAFIGGQAPSKLYVGLANTAFTKISTLTDAYNNETLGYISPPPTPPTPTLAGVGAGALSNGDYSYKITFVTANGETEASTASITATVFDNGADGRIALTSIPLGPAGVTQRKIYRTAAGGSSWLFLATIADNSSTTYEDNLPDSGLGTAAPVSNSTKQRLSTVAPTGSVQTSAGNLSAGNYRYKVTFVTAAGETDASPASSVITITNPSSAGQIAVSFSVGSTGVTARKLYRTEAGGSVYKYLATISDNVTTTYVDNIADASLGSTEPELNTTANNGYKRQVLNLNALDVVNSLLDTDDWAVITKNYTFTANTQDIGPFNAVFLADTPSGSSGNLYAWWDLTASHTLTNGESLTWSGKIRQT